MSNVSNFLDRLTRIDGYRELQTIFAEIVAQANSEGDRSALARGIDEAIHRFETERAKDEQELADFKSRYASFLTENKGVMGWFKRHLPFSATRRQDRDHRDSVAEQEAEILADNLVIARAQMIKERLLGSADRKLGYRVAEWQAKFNAAAGEKQLSPLADVLKNLSSEMERSGPFLAAVKEDVDAFAGAAFKTAEDRKLRDADLATARKEFAELTEEIQEKHAMKKAGLKQIASRVAAELEIQDPDFRANGEKAQHCQQALGQIEQAQSGLKKLSALVATVGNLGKELRRLPGESQQLRDALKQLETKCADSNFALANKQTVFDGQRGRHEAARREVEQTQQLLVSAQRSYEAYQEESRAKQALSGQAEENFDQGSDSPLLRRFHEAKAAAESAQARLREATIPYNSAKKDVEAAQASFQKCEKERDAARDKLQALELRLPKLRSEFADAIARLHSPFSAAATGLATYLAREHGKSLASYRPQELAAGIFGVLGPQGLERGLADALVSAERDPHRFEQGEQVLGRLARWLESEQKVAEGERTTALQRRKTIWNGRCAELLGDALASEACGAEFPEQGSKS